MAAAVVKTVSMKVTVDVVMEGGGGGSSNPKPTQDRQRHHYGGHQGQHSIVILV